MTDPVEPGPAAPLGAFVPPHIRHGRQPGRPNIQMSLRVPASWISELRERAIAAAHREDCMITPQDIVRRIIAEALRKPL